ncbi:MAG TPA: flagellar motor switch protein FliM, partial [candidate division Zixibacteria bacterium]|nr:flagellar motor switch protein FliM [candidate division Zixibacteria bacterium]
GEDDHPDGGHGGMDEILRPVVAYDFKHPNRVSKDQIRTMENLHDNFAGHLGSSLSAMMRAVVDVELVSVDQITYSEFIMSLVSPSCTYTFRAQPMDGACVIDFSPTLTFGFVERIFGGSGKTLEADRELTGIERTVMGRVVGQLYTDLESAREHIAPVKCELVSFENNPQFVQVVPPGETVVVVSFQLKLFKTSGLLSICYPYVSLESIIHKLSAQNWIDSTKKKSGPGDRITNTDNIQDVGAELTALLGVTELTVRDFLAVKHGDIITLDRKVSESLDVLVNGRSKYLAFPGLSGRKKAVQVAEILDTIGKKSNKESA